MKTILLLPAVIGAAATAPVVHAYVGPGATLGAVVLVLGVLGALVLWVFALAWYPFKRLWQRWRGTGKEANAGRGAPTTEDQSTRQ